MAAGLVLAKFKGQAILALTDPQTPQRVGSVLDRELTQMERWGGSGLVQNLQFPRNEGEQGLDECENRPAEKKKESHGE